jgi:inositol transport system substrate-binding protein
MRKLVTLLSVALAVAMLIGAVQAGEKKKLAYIARAQGDSFAAWLANSVQEEVEANYPDMEVTIFDGQSNNETISSHIENATINRFDAILLQPFDVEANRYPLMQAVEQGRVGACVKVQIPAPKLGNVDANP